GPRRTGFGNVARSGDCRRSVNRATCLALSIAILGLAATSTVQPAVAQQPAAGTATTWYFAEGTTLPGWFEFLVLINPDPNVGISVHVAYQLEQPAGVAQPGRTQDVTVPAGGRTTVAVYDVVGRPFTGVAARLTSSASFVAERPMYFVNAFDIGAVNGAHDAL